MNFFKDERDWFFKKRFGLFVHFGLYSIEGFHEQEQFRKGIPRKEYEKYASVFNPEKFDPYVWIETAKKCGMEYMVFTAKHQDGFCMWNTKTTDYNIINTPYGRDLLKELSDACHSEKFPLIIYYCITDNHHPNYPNRGKWHELPHPEDGDRPDRDKYLDYLKRQVIELCSDYGKIHGFFWDANHLDYRDESINWIIRDIQPAAVINGRGFDSGDYNTPEREFNDAEISSVRSFTKPTEACQSFGIHSWGYRKDEDFYSTKYLIRSIDRILSMGGNFLLNIAPDASGQLDSRAVKKAEEIGKWFAKANKKISACTDEAQTEFYNLNIKFRKTSFRYMRGLQNLVNKYPKKQRQYRLLVGCGEHDIPAEIEIVNEWAKYENCDKVILKGAGHCANMDNPQAFNQYLTKFLSSCQKELTIEKSSKKEKEL